MKYTLLILAVLSFSAYAKTPKKTNEQIVCEKLVAKAEDDCTREMCEQYKTDSGEEECVMDGDFHEGLQICVYDSALPDLIKEYNKKNPKAKVTCEDI